MLREARKAEQRHTDVEACGDKQTSKNGQRHMTLVIDESGWSLGVCVQVHESKGICKF